MTSGGGTMTLKGGSFILEGGIMTYEGGTLISEEDTVCYGTCLCITRVYYDQGVIIWLLEMIWRLQTLLKRRSPLPSAAVSQSARGSAPEAASVCPCPEVMSYAALQKIQLRYEILVVLDGYLS